MEKECYRLIRDHIEGMYCNSQFSQHCTGTPFTMYGKLALQIPTLHFYSIVKHRFGKHLFFYFIFLPQDMASMARVTCIINNWIESHELPISILRSMGDEVNNLSFSFVHLDSIAVKRL